MNYLGNKNKFMFVLCQGSNPPEEMMVDTSDLDTFLLLRWITYAFIHSPAPLLSLCLTHTHIHTHPSSLGLSYLYPLRVRLQGQQGPDGHRDNRWKSNYLLVFSF